MFKLNSGELIEGYRAVRDLNVRAFDRIRRDIRGGCTEKELYDAVADEYTSNSGGRAVFQGDFISGERTWGIEGPATDRVIRRGDTIIVDAVCSYNGICCDSTRSFFCGEPDGEMKRVYSVLCKVLEETAGLLVPGARSCDIFFFMDRRFREEGYVGMVHHAGHGLGETWLQAPFFVADCETPLEEDMLVALEPGIYLENKFGLRIENDYRVTKNGGVDVFAYTLRMEDFIIG